MRVLFMLLLALPAHAQLAGQDIPVEGALRGRTAVPAVVTAEVAEVRAGPGAAYVSRGRAYRDDAAKVMRRNEAGDWVEVRVGGLRGWVRMGDLRLRAPGDRTREDGTVDSGRDRRQSNYTYDAQGRRLRADGTPMGSGEGTADGPAPPRTRAVAERAGPSVSLAVGVAQYGRTFSSNADPASPLDVLEANPTGLATTLTVEWSPIPFLALTGQFRDSRLGTVALGANPDAGFDQAVDLGVDAQELHLDVAGGYPLSGIWLGAYAGVRLIRHAFQETAPYSIFLSNTFVGLGAGGRVAAAFGPISAVLEGGVVLPLSVSQAPAEGGSAEVTGAEARLELGYAFSANLALIVHGHFTQLVTDFTGEGTHVDTVNESTYDDARETDTFLGGGAGVRWTFR